MGIRFLDKLDSDWGCRSDKSHMTSRAAEQTGQTHTFGTRMAPDFVVKGLVSASRECPHSRVTIRMFLA